MYFSKITVIGVFCNMFLEKIGVTVFCWVGFRVFRGKLEKNGMMFEFSCLLRCDKGKKVIFEIFFVVKKWDNGIFLFFMIRFLVGFHKRIEIILFRYHKYLEIRRNFWFFDKKSASCL